MICPRCEIWEIREGDNYCSWCQNKFVSLDLLIQPSRFLQDDLPPPARLTVTNPTQNEVVISSVRPSAAWISIPSNGHAISFTLGPGQRRCLTIEIDPLDLENEYATGRILLESNAGSYSVEIEVVPRPEIRITTGEYEIFLDNRALEQTFAHVQVDSGVIVVTSISAEPAEWASVKTVDDVQFPITLDARGQNTLELRFVIDEAYLLTLPGKYPAVYDGKLKITCTDFEREEPFRVRCWKPPELWVWEESDPRVTAYAGKKGELTLSVQNKMPGDPLAGQGNAVLEIRSIEIRNPDGSENHAIVAEHIEEPVCIAGGALRQFRLAFDTDGTAPGAFLAIGQHYVEVILHTSLYEPTHTVRFEVEVARMPVYDGILALDFGTSNTCCATLGRHEDRFVMLPLDSPQHNRQPTTMPTVIQYCDQRNGERVFRIGALVETLAIDPRAAGTTVRSPKRRLGHWAEADKFDVRFFYNLEKKARLLPRDVVADYLDMVRLAAEEHGRAVFKRIIITHPARFRMNQLRDLESAVRAAFGSDCEISTLQEPLAAALDFMVGETALATQRYALGVFDFGGGTTDMSLLEVENLKKGNFTEIRAKVVSSAGKWFGGEDLTRFVMDAGLARCQAIAQQLRTRAEIFTEASQAPDPSRSWLARSNGAALLHWAECTKLLLVRYGDGHEAQLASMPGMFSNLKLNVFTPSGVEELQFPHSEIVPKEAELWRHLESELLKLTSMLKGLVAHSETACLDYILLSGKSSAIRLVGEVLKREFPSSTVRLAPEPKECVVSGACILEKLQDAADMYLNIEGGAATTSRIGFENVGPGGTKIFQVLVEAGVPIPDHGLTTMRPCLLNRRKEIRLLENDSEDNALWILGKENPNISELGVYVMDNPPDWLPQRPVPASLELTVSQNLDFHLAARVEGHEDLLTFAAKQDVQAAVC
jgi:hypothetical protein